MTGSLSSNNIIQDGFYDCGPVRRHILIRQKILRYSYFKTVQILDLGFVKSLSAWSVTYSLLSVLSCGWKIWKFRLEVEWKNDSPKHVLNLRTMSKGIQLFRQRLSHKSVKKRTRQCRMVLRVARVWFCLIEVQGDSATRNENERINVFVLFPSTTLKHPGFTQVTVKTTVTHNILRHCRVSFSPFIRQPFSKKLYTPFFPSPTRGWWSEISLAFCSVLLFPVPPATEKSYNQKLNY